MLGPLEWYYRMEHVINKYAYAFQNRVVSYDDLKQEAFIVIEDSLWKCDRDRQLVPYLIVAIRNRLCDVGSKFLTPCTASSISVRRSFKNNNNDPKRAYVPRYCDMMTVEHMADCNRNSLPSPEWVDFLDILEYEDELGGVLHGIFEGKMYTAIRRVREKTRLIKGYYRENGTIEGFRDSEEIE